MSSVGRSERIGSGDSGLTLQVIRVGVAPDLPAHTLPLVTGGTIFPKPAIWSFMTSKRESHYIFFRKEGWYPLVLRDDEDARTNAETNPGTVRVENIDGRVIWQPTEKRASVLPMA